MALSRVWTGAAGGRGGAGRGATGRGATGRGATGRGAAAYRRAADRQLAASYRRCQELHRACGTTYWWATWALPAEARRHVHALYGFCRLADDIVDRPAPSGPCSADEALAGLGERMRAGLAAGGSDDPYLAAVVHTATVLGIGSACFERFLRSMAMDLAVRSYESFDDLLGYMDGSAAVIGEMMLAVLRPTSDAALGPARDLGIAFQLTNFLRDVGEDLDRGRVYLPQCDLRRFGALGALAERRARPEWVALMRYQIDRARGFYASALPGLALLPPAGARCVASALSLYSGILGRIEANGYDVFNRRARVPTPVKVATVARAMLRGSPSGAIPG